MKKIAAAIIFFIFLNTSIFSQNAFQRFRFGIQFSPTITWMDSADKKINSNGTNAGLKLGVIGESYFAENYAFFFGLGFAFNQGGTLKHDIGGNLWPNSPLSSDVYQKGPAMPDGVNLKYGLQYVEIPFGLRLRSQEFGYLRYFAELPVFTLGFSTQAKGAIKGTDMDTEKEDISKDVNGVAFSWGLGGGIEYSLGSQTSLIAGIYYQNFITDVTKDDGQKYVERDQDGLPVTTAKENSKALIRGITIRLGVMF
jgi:hypothetical protein